VFSHHKSYITQCSLRTPDGELISNQINMVIIELSKLESILEKPIDEMSSLDMWSIFIGLADDPRQRTLINSIIERKEVLGMASAVLTAISKDEHERAKFMSRRKAETDRISNLLTAESRGEERGIAIGEEQARNITARKMKADGMSIEVISKYTGLSGNDIEKL